MGVGGEQGRNLKELEMWDIAAVKSLSVRRLISLVRAILVVKLFSLGFNMQLMTFTLN
jgi:hypothetical protein